LAGPNKELRAYIGLGGNIGDPAASMASALHLLASNPSIAVEKVSSLYRTPPWGKTDQPDFLNACAELATELTPPQLLDACLDVEAKLKRVRRERWGPRVIDIDILVHWAGNFHSDGLSIPHPRMGERAFVLVPLAEIVPELDVEGRLLADMAKQADSAGMSVIAGPDWWLDPRQPE
jgi:2-amino-4-hydroxy-6-hydroxymethyldihydropteridine diphosphokinase